MKLSKVKFEVGKCYRAVDKGATTFKVFKFKALHPTLPYVDAFRGISIYPYGVTMDWCTASIEDYDIEEIDESVIYKLDTLFEVNKAAMISTIKGKKYE